MNAAVGKAMTIAMRIVAASMRIGAPTQVGSSAMSAA